MSWHRRLVIVLVLLPGLPVTQAWAGAPVPAGDVLVVSGSVTNPHGKGIKDAEPRFFVDGAPLTLLLSEVSPPMSAAPRCSSATRRTL